MKEVDVWLDLFKECHAGDAISILVGNKVDKLSATEKITLQIACAQQVFVVSRRTRSRFWNTKEDPRA